MKNLVLIAIGVVGCAAAAQGAVTTYYTNLSGPAEAPPNASPGTGWARVDYNDVARTMRVRASFSGLLGNVTVAHIHGATAAPFTGTAGVVTAVPTFPGFPAGGTSGVYDAIFDLSLSSSWNPTYITANGGTTLSAESAFFSAMTAGRTYFNLHSSQFPGGELRGFLAVPTPASLAALGLSGLLATRRRR